MMDWLSLQHSRTGRLPEGRENQFSLRTVEEALPCAEYFPLYTALATRAHIPLSVLMCFVLLLANRFRAISPFEKR